MDKRSHEIRQELFQLLKQHDQITDEFYDRLVYYIERMIHNEVREQLKYREKGGCKDE